MSEMMIEHPIAIIENLLKLRKGDEGRLLYLRKAITLGKTIYESDKKYLKKLQNEISLNSDKTSDDSTFEKTENDKNFSSKSWDGSNIIDFEFDIENIQTSLESLKRKEAQIKDNLSLLLINREISSQRDLDKSNSYGKFSNLPKTSSSDLFDVLHNHPSPKPSKFFGMTNYDLMTYLSAGFFSLWIAGNQNLIELGSLQGLSLGFSIGSAVSAGVLYFKAKNKP